MLIETVETETRPMLYVTRTSGMEPRAIADAMAGAFSAMGAFLQVSGVKPAGPPLALYHDRNLATGTIRVDVGFPVTAHDTTKAAGAVHAGQTPSGRALKAFHHVAYATMPRCYECIAAHMEKFGLGVPASSWEVYLNDPRTTPEPELLTEIYVPVHKQPIVAGGRIH